MKLKIARILLLSLINIPGFAQQRPEITIRYSKLFSAYEFVQKLSGDYPDNRYKEFFKSSSFHTKEYSDLIKQWDSLKIYYAFDYPDYPVGQKTSVATTSLIEKNLSTSATINEFKRQTFGIIPADDLLRFSNILEKFLPVYEALVYKPNQEKFENKIKDLETFVQKTQLEKYFEEGLRFYHTAWDFAVPIDITVAPSIEEGGFTGKAFLNIAVTEVPLNFVHNDVLFSVLMHEIYHTVYNEQPLTVKKAIQAWFQDNPSRNSRYAFFLLNEVLATALGNGYVYEQINGKTDPDDWYNTKYINQMAKKIYPTVIKYIAEKKSIDKDFIDTYIALYDQFFADWTKEFAHLFTYRYILSDNDKDFDYFFKNYRYASNYEHETGIGAGSIEKIKASPLTKVIIVSNQNKQKLKWVKEAFPELKDWKYNPKKEFAYTIWLKDKTRLFLINQLNTPLGQLIERDLLPKQ